MPIRVPGKRSHGHRRTEPTKRNAVAVLQLTAMVDMFTVLVVFLLQNWASTQQILPLPEAVELPTASSVKELKPSNVIVVSNNEIKLNSTRIADFRSIKEQEDWMIMDLKNQLEELIRVGEAKKSTLKSQIQQAVTDAQASGTSEKAVDDFRKITIQADKTVDFLTVKKVMYTVTEAGVYEINFAVIKNPEDKGAS